MSIYVSAAHPLKNGSLRRKNETVLSVQSSLVSDSLLVICFFLFSGVELDVLKT